VACRAGLAGLGRWPAGVGWRGWSGLLGFRGELNTMISFVQWMESSGQKEDSSATARAVLAFMLLAFLSLGCIDSTCCGGVGLSLRANVFSMHVVDWFTACQCAAVSV